MPSFETDIKYLKGVGTKRAEALNRLGIDTVGALLRFYPRAYEDWSDVKKIADCTYGEQVAVKATIITEISKHIIRSNMTLYKFVIADNSERMTVTIFNNRYLAERLSKGREYLFFGKIGMQGFFPTMSSPEIRETSAVGIVPIYHAGSGMSSKMIEKLVKTALTAELPPDPIPEGVRRKNNLCDLAFALENIHFPRTRESLDRARRRLVFEELFILQTGLALLKGKRRNESSFILKSDTTDEFLSMLPFKLTGAQLRTVRECVKDMMSGSCMNRLVQGDVGSGKTAVAAALLYNTVKCGMQAAFMAPTEILAEQHFATLTSMLENSGIRCTLLTGSLSKKKKDELKAALARGEYDIAVGTHALLSDDVIFDRLGLVITDEQHRFGVAQRAKLAAKGSTVHTLVMSATPIPRTLALIIYGDLDISIIDEYPKGRQQIKSYAVKSELRPRVFNFIKKHLDEGRQGYIVCPMVEENEEMPVVSAQEYFAKISDGEFKDYRVGLLHGKMSARDKDAVMRSFKQGEIQLLVCTTVIEVGIDVPNAAIMLIENAERFGLSQLHQLRGRIGRGSFESSCIFMSDYAAERLSVISKTSDGFKIAEEDLRLRGPGDFLGQRQHGLPELRIADIAADRDTLRLAGNAVAELLQTDPRLKSEENLPLRKEIIKLYKSLNEN